MIYLPVIDSTLPPGQHVHPPDGKSFPLPVNKWAVRILLECFLVWGNVFSLNEKRFTTTRELINNVEINHFEIHSIQLLKKNDEVPCC